MSLDPAPVSAAAGYQMNTARPLAITRFIRVVQHNVQWIDLLLFLYILAFVRQYFWILNHNRVAWALSALVAIALSCLYISTRQLVVEKPGWSFWLVVALPLCLAYLMRAAFPDRSFDVLSYHLLHAERSLHGTLFYPLDFFPTVSSFNPIADTLTGISRLLLGFRLGTIINFFALLWVGLILNWILASFIRRAWVRSACVLLTLITENALFEISTYMVDLLALPLLFYATLLTLNADDLENRQSNSVHVAILLGASTAFKFTNFAAALPILAIVVYRMMLGPQRLSPRQLGLTALKMLLGFVAPLLPFTIYIYSRTGNPIFPLANKFFSSPYWPTHGGWDARWGPNGFWETLIWPVVVWFKPERSSELAVYSGRLSLGFIAALVGLLLGWRNRSLRTICFILLTSTLLWSAVGLGYSRYGLYQELLAGVTTFAVAAVLLQKTASKLSWRTALASLFCVALISQVLLACSYARQKEWGGRTTLIANPEAYAREARFMLRDRSIRDHFNSEELALFDGVHVWMETCPQSTGFEVLLKPGVPIIAARQPEYFFTRESRRQFVNTVEQLPGDTMFSLCFPEYIETSRQAIAARGLEMGRITPVQVPFFSPNQRIGLVLIEVLRPQGEARQKFQSSWMNAAFPDYDYREQITALDAPSSMRAGQKATIRFKVKNLGYATWPAVGNKEGRYQVNIGDRWLSADGAVEINQLDGRTGMPNDLLPGKEIELPLNVKAPQTTGEYILEIDMVHEGVSWFYERGAKPLRLRVRVEP